jgi:hypothetical protein
MIEPVEDAATDAELEVSLIRPFTLTRGRTRSDGGPIPVEAAVCQSPASRSAPPLLGPVETEIWTAAAGQLSVAEISGRLGLALGVVRVLVGDLAGVGLIELGPTAGSGDAELVRRLIDGVRAL